MIVWDWEEEPVKKALFKFNLQFVLLYLKLRVFCNKLTDVNLLINPQTC